MKNTLGGFLKAQREAQGSSLREFADKLNISHSYLSKLESDCDSRTGRAVAPTIEILIQIADALNLSLTELLKISGYIESETSFNSDSETLTTHWTQNAQVQYTKKQKEKLTIEDELDEKIKKIMLMTIKMDDEQKKQVLTFAKFVASDNNSLQQKK